MPIYVPYNDVQYLATTRASWTSTSYAGTLTAAVPGPEPDRHQVDRQPVLRLPGRLHGRTLGATLTVAARRQRPDRGGQTITDNGALNFATGDHRGLRASLLRHDADPGQYGGDMTASARPSPTPATPTTPSTSIAGQLRRRAHGQQQHLQPQPALPGNGSVLNEDDLTSDIFNMPIYVPYDDVQYPGQQPELPGRLHHTPAPSPAASRWP